MYDWAYLNIIHGEKQGYPQRMTLHYICIEFILCSCDFYPIHFFAKYHQQVI